MRQHKTTALLLITLIVAACGGGGDPASANVAQQVIAYTYNAPSAANDGWATGHLDDHGFDNSIVVDMVNRIYDGTYSGIDGVAIVRDNTLILYEPFRTELGEYDSWVNNGSLPRHILHSTSKSVTSALIGIAVDQGYIASTSVPFYSLFNYPVYQNWDPRKQSMTLEDALTMRLGLKWDEWSEPYGDADNDLHKLTTSRNDVARGLLDLELESDPGTTFTYNTAATIAIGQALENAVGMPMADFAETHLFGPLQIRGAKWGRTGTGLPNGGSGLFLTPREMAKFGQLFISGGIWNGEQVISKQWVEESVQRHVDLDWNWTSGYGYQWWRGKFTDSTGRTQLESWSTRGFGGQYIFCVPELNLVVTFTGQNYGNAGADYAFSLMQDFIIRAIANPG